jgi:hypothetical protein
MLIARILTSRVLLADRAISISKTRGLHHATAPVRPQRETRTDGATHASGEATAHSAAALNGINNVMSDCETEAPGNWTYWRKVWRSLVFVDGWVTFISVVHSRFKQAMTHALRFPGTPHDEAVRPDGKVGMRDGYPVLCELTISIPYGLKLLYEIYFIRSIPRFSWPFFVAVQRLGLFFCCSVSVQRIV